MEIKTKYNIGDEVWFMNNNKPKSMKVWDIEVQIKTAFDGQYDYGYYIRSYYHDFGCHNIVEVPNLFPTKEELLKSL